MQKVSGNCRLSRKQEQGVIELLDPSNKSKSGIAEKLNISERTLYNWLKLPHFRDRLNQDRVKMVKEALENINDLSIKASRGLEELMESDHEYIKLKACQTVINYNLKILDYQELGNRINELEETLIKGGIR